MATFISGKNGLLKIGAVTISGVRNWKADLKSNNPQFATNDGPGHKVSVGGVKSGSVSFDLVLDTAAQQYVTNVTLGTNYTLLCYEDATRFWSIPVRIDSIGESVDINDGGEVTLSVQASTNGAWTYPGGSVSV